MKAILLIVLLTTTIARGDRGTHIPPSLRGRAVLDIVDVRKRSSRYTLTSTLMSPLSSATDKEVFASGRGGRKLKHLLIPPRSDNPNRTYFPLRAQLRNGYFENIHIEKDGSPRYDMGGGRSERFPLLEPEVVDELIELFSAYPMNHPSVEAFFAWVRRGRPKPTYKLELLQPGQKPTVDVRKRAEQLMPSVLASPIATTAYDSMPHVSGPDGRRLTHIMIPNNKRFPALSVKGTDGIFRQFSIRDDGSPRFSVIVRHKGPSTFRLSDAAINDVVQFYKKYPIQHAGVQKFLGWAKRRNDIPRTFHRDDNAHAKRPPNIQPENIKNILATLRQRRPETEHVVPRPLQNKVPAKVEAQSSNIVLKVPIVRKKFFRAYNKWYVKDVFEIVPACSSTPVAKHRVAQVAGGVALCDYTVLTTSNCAIYTTRHHPYLEIQSGATRVRIPSRAIRTIVPRTYRFNPASISGEVTKAARQDHALMSFRERCDVIATSKLAKFAALDRTPGRAGVVAAEVTDPLALRAATHKNLTLKLAAHVHEGTHWTATVDKWMSLIPKENFGGGIYNKKGEMVGMLTTIKPFGMDGNARNFWVGFDPYAVSWAQSILRRLYPAAADPQRSGGV